MWLRKLEQLPSTIEWKSCGESDLRISGSTCSRGNLKVPSTYERPMDATLTLGVQKFTLDATTTTTTTPTTHVILLAGGPGGYSRSMARYVRPFLKSGSGRVAVYLVDHRGVGMSSQISSQKDVFLNPSALQTALTMAPFDVRHLTLENAALDVALLGVACRNKGRVVLLGFSYGAQWAHHAVQLVPDLFDAAILGGMPSMRGYTREADLKGVAEACSQDPFCRRKMGPDAYKTLQRATIKVVQRDYNACTRLLHDQLPLNGPSGAKIYALAGSLVPIIHKKGLLKKLTELRGVQVVLPFIKATYDCVDVGAYRDKVLIKLLPVMDKVTLARSYLPSNDGRKLNKIVHDLVTLDESFGDFRTGAPYIHSSFNNLHPAPFATLGYYARWKLVEPFLKNRKLSVGRPVVTDKTAIFIAASRMDPATPPHAAWDLFDKIKSPKKGWLLFDNRSHDGYVGVCYFRFIKLALSNQLDNFDYAECIRRDNAERAPDWRMSGELSTMWDLVRDETEGPPFLENLPTFRLEMQNDKVREQWIWPRSRPVLGATMWVALTITLIMLVSAVTFLIMSIVKRRRAKSPLNP